MGQTSLVDFPTNVSSVLMTQVAARLRCVASRQPQTSIRADSAHVASAGEYNPCNTRNTNMLVAS